jgi:hypothetical protein
VFPLNPWLAVVPWIAFFTQPAGCVVIYSVWWLLIVNLDDQSDEQRESSYAGGVLGGMGFVASTFFSIRWMLFEYSNLPTKKPNCYVSSAAAYGTPWIVGAKRIRIGEEFVLVNSQMQYLKVLELILKFACPKTHHRIRTQYDRWGPPMALRCEKSRWIANSTFIALLPLEWCARVLCLLIGITAKETARIYRH